MLGGWRRREGGSKYLGPLRLLDMQRDVRPWLDFAVCALAALGLVSTALGLLGPLGPPSYRYG